MSKPETIIEVLDGGRKKVYWKQAIDNLYPSKMGRAPGHTSLHDPINILPKFVSDILSDKNTIIKKANKRTVYESGDIKLITKGKIIVTVTRVNKKLGD